jgi:protein involved in polysaccharide export with SLBB domain
MQPPQSKSLRLRIALLSCTILLAFQGIPLAAQDSSANQNPAGSNANAPESSAQNPPTANRGLHLGPGDLVEMSAYNVPELNTKARVTSKGDIYFPFIGYTHVAGLTTEEAQTARGLCCAL